MRNVCYAMASFRAHIYTGLKYGSLAVGTNLCG